jgi:nitrate/nitrite transporter NarK
VTATVRATVGGCALGVAVAWPVTNIGAIADAVAADYGVSLAVVGLFTTALFVTHASLQIPAGKAVDAVGARRVGLVALAVVAATSGLALAAPDPGLVLVARTLTGIGTALGFVAGIDYVRAHGGSPFAQGLYGGLAMGGAGAALAIVPLAEEWLDWRAPFVTSLAVVALAAVPLALGPLDAEGSRPERHADVHRVPRVLRDARLYRLCLVYMASFGLSIVLGNWVATLLTRAGEMSEAAAGAIGSLILLGGVVSRPLGGTLARRYGERTRLILGGSFVASAIGTALLAIAGPAVLSAAGALLLGFAAGIPFASVFAAATRTRPDAPAVAAAMVNMSGNLIIVVCTPLLGLAFSLPGDGRVGFAAVAAIWLATLALLPLVRELDTAPGAAPGGAREAAASP